MNLGTCVYVPPKGRLNSDAFMSNISAYSSKHPIYFYSDEKGRGIENIIANPEVTRNPHRPWIVNNTIFLFGLKLASDAKLDYMLYCESDSRVKGDHWDGVMFDEMFAGCKEPLCYGTPVAWNISQAGGEALKKVTEFGCRVLNQSGLPMPVYGWHRPGSLDTICVYPNGSLSILHMPTMLEIFNGFDVDIGRAAAQWDAWDLIIGRGIWKKFGVGLFDMFSIATKSYSGYGDAIVNESQRRDMLTGGKVVAAHQFKSDWIP